MQFQSPLHAVAAAVRSIFERWTALMLTVEHQRGDCHDKARQLLDSTVAMATNPNVRHSEDNYIDMFYAAFDSMDTDVEDGSPEQVAAHIVRVRDCAARGDFRPAIEALQQPGAPTSLFGTSVDGSQPCSGQVANNGIAPETYGTFHSSEEQKADEDGFTEVRRRSRNRQTPQRYAP